MASNHCLEYAVAVGVGEFPFDMLRYDQAYPAIENEMYVLTESDPTRERAIVLNRWKCQPGSFTPQRWQSFLWKIEFFKHIEDARNYSEKINQRV